MSSTSFSSRSCPLIACLAVLIITTALHITSTVYTVGLQRQSLPPTKEYTYIDADYPAQLPLKLPAVGLVLEESSSHFSLYDDDEWGTLFPSDGFTDVGPNNRTFLLSMIHQLHCLDIIRVGFVVNGTSAAPHIQHCLRYLRQIILCYADTTLETDHPLMFEGKPEHAAHGVGEVHRCKDWSLVRRHLLENPSSPPQL